MCQYLIFICLLVSIFYVFSNSCLAPVFETNFLSPEDVFSEEMINGDFLSENSCESHKMIEKSYEDFDPIMRRRRDKIREMMQHAWTNYKMYAWGANELSPLSKKAFHGGVFGKNDIGLTIIDALDTLFIMGMKDEYEEGRMWIENNFTLENVNGPIDAFEVNIRIIGSFLSLYAVTDDELYKIKAKYVDDKILPVFETQTGIPKALIDFKKNLTENYQWAYGGSSILSQYGSYHLEFTYLTEITGEDMYITRVSKVRDFLEGARKPYGLYPIYINPEDGEWGLHYMSIGGYGDSFYEYLFKSWMQSNFKDKQGKNMFVNAMTSIEKHLIGKSSNHATYLGFLKFGELEPKMDQLSCFTGGLFSLAGHYLNQTKYITLAKKIAETCHESYSLTVTGLGPEHFWFYDSMKEAQATKPEEARFALRPETIESYFYLWRLTNDSKYREWAWDFVESLEQYCRTPNGYSGVKNVYASKIENDDIQHSYFLAETLKYLYLIFSDNSLLSLDKWVFNTEGHPLPILY